MVYYDLNAIKKNSLAHGADEAVVVPMSVLERDEAGAADTCRYNIA